MNRVIAFVLAALLVSNITARATAATRQSKAESGAPRELINQPCQSDEHHGRWPFCDVGDYR
jgi:hypothetical protein